MEDSPHVREFDWSTFWTEAGADRRRTAHVGQFDKAELLERFFERTGVPDSLASFGCGPAACPFEIAERYPEMDVYGYDAAETVIEEDTKRAREAGLENIEFGVERLPDIETTRTFDCVYCYSTLHYVRDATAALHALYGRVAEGGFLVFNYPNRFTRAKARREIDDERRRERYAHVLAGENLLSYGEIRDILGAVPRSYWSLVDARDKPWVTRGNPCVYVRK